MNLHQWDVVRVRVRSEDKDVHPAVVLSREEWCQDERHLAINVLYCTTKRPADEPGPLDVLLNGADGLERLTLTGCGFVYSVPRVRITAVAGRVSPERRRRIGRTIVAAFRLPL